MKKSFLAVITLSILTAGLLYAADGPSLGAIKVGSDIDKPNRAIVGEATTFPAGTARICAYVEILNAGEPKNIVFKWLLNDQESDKVVQQVQGSRWRTWSCKNNLANGSWKVDIQLEADNSSLGSAAFTIGP